MERDLDAMAGPCSISLVPLPPVTGAYVLAALRSSEFPHEVHENAAVSKVHGPVPNTL